MGLEKRIAGDLDALATKLNASEAHGPRLLPVLGQVITEIDAITMLTGANAELVAAGGVCGAEGCIWLAIDGEPKQMEAVEKSIEAIRTEPLFEF